MSRSLWKEPERYIETHWLLFRHVWVGGDWAAADSDALWYVLGRSEDPKKVVGKKLGPA